MRHVNSCIKLLAITLALVLNVTAPCQADWEWEAVEDDEWWYDSPSTGGDGQTYGWTTNVIYANVALSENERGVSAMVTVELTGMVELLNQEGSASRDVSAYSYTCGGADWEWTGAPGEAPAMTVHQMEIVESGPTGSIEMTGSIDDSNGYPGTEVEAYSYARCIAVSHSEDYTQAGAWAEGWADDSSSNGQVDPDHDGVGNCGGYLYEDPGEYELFYTFYWVSNDAYGTASGLSEISGAVGVFHDLDVSGSVDASTGHPGSVSVDASVYCTGHAAVSLTETE